MEVFKEIVGYENKYSISNTGKVFSTPSDGKPKRFLKQEKIKKNHTTYCRVSLSKDGEVKRFSVHRLVAEAFISNPHNKPDVNHKDNNGENNNKSNLEWCTKSENTLHALKQGRMKNIEASNQATIIRDKKTTNKFTLKFGSRFIGIEKKDKRTYIKYNCFNCNYEMTARIDSKFIKNKGRCKNCKDEDIV